MRKSNFQKVLIFILYFGSLLSGSVILGAIVRLAYERALALPYLLRLELGGPKCNALHLPVLGKLGQDHLCMFEGSVVTGKPGWTTE